MMRMTGVSMMAGTIGLVLHVIYQVSVYGMQALESLQLVQAVLDTSFGGMMLSMGAPLAVIGTLVQWGVAVTAAFGYVVAARIVPLLFHFPMSLGALYGMGVFAVSNYAVPLWLDPGLQLPPLTGQLAGMCAQALLYGIPMAFTAKTMMRS